MRHLLIAFFLTATLQTSLAHGYGNRGHHLVGAIADRRLTHNAELNSKISKLLNGLSLQTVAVYPDTILKNLDKHANNLDVVFSAVPELKTRSALVEDLKAFWTANHDKPLSTTSENRHHLAHFTDVPVIGDLQYHDGGPGQTEFDIVHAIPRCIRVLQNRTTAADKDRKISPAVAVILLAHYVGDIHQPLHVGAEYFNSEGKPVDPSTISGFRPDEGGNEIKFVFHPPHTPTAENLHAFWDTNAVNLAFPNHDDLANADELAGDEPSDWQLDSSVNIDLWSIRWANDILPLAQQAHNITFTGISHDSQGHPVFTASVRGDQYPAFAGQTVKTEIHKAGWRLAAVLEKALQN